MPKSVAKSQFFMFLALIVGLLFIGFIASQFVKNATQKESVTSETQAYPLVFFGERGKIRQAIESYNENKGRSEAFFYKYLQKYFPKQVYTDLALPIGKAYYYPDFTLISEKHQLYVDIEIDEPYNFKGYPTHIKGSDDKRNTYFVQCGWVVIRFAEEQIARQPLQCCKFIAQTLNQISRDKCFLKEDLQPIPDLSLRPKIWDSRKAKQMALNKTRDYYANIFR